jgi:hypothetical protein
MNFRGSAGYVRKFIDGGNNEWARKMQDDVTWGAKYLIAVGIADPERVRIFGGSYGGCATLAGVAFTPRRLRGGGGPVRPVESDHTVEFNPALLGGGTPDVLPAHGQSDHDGRQGPPGRALAAECGRQDQDAANNRAGSQRSSS